MILYNGSSGGIGRYLAAALASRGLPGVALSARLEDRSGLRRELDALRPGGDPVLIQLAARVSVPACEADPEGAYQTNVADTVATVETFVEWSRSRSAEPKVIYVSTGHVYAAGDEGSRVTEAAPTQPRSVYARSKLLAEGGLRSRCRDLEVPLLVTRVFGLVGPGQAPNYLMPGLIERVKSGRVEGIPGLDFVRDYLDARDVCADLLALVPTISMGGSIVNICSGRPVSIRDVLRQVALELKPREAAALLASATAAPGRPDDVRWIVGDPSRFVELTGAAPQQIPLAVTVHDAASDR